jgi:hypothetical protein
MQQAIQNNRRGGEKARLGLKDHLTLAGTMAGELIALASLVAGLAAGLVSLAMILA